MPTVIHLPSLSPGMSEGKLVRWLKKEGDWVDRGDVIAEIETDKSVLDLEAIDAGRLAQILVLENVDGIAVGTPLALLEKAGENEPALVAPRSQRIAVSPLARRIAAESGIDLQDITGSGPRGRIVKADVDRALGAQQTDSYTIVTNSSARKIIARRLTQAASAVPHFYLTIDCPVDRLMALREELNAEVAARDRLSINDLIVRACALALRRVPRVNASWGGEAIRLHRDVDIAVAVATTDGLTTPIVRRADTKSVATIAVEMRHLAERARAHKLRPEEFQGGGFSISNLGMHGIRQFTAIINPPHAAILAVGAAEARSVVRAGELAIATMMTCTLSCDHRVLDGVTGAEFLNCFRDLIAEPDQLG
jgi:pyruvate dehydrogenase E2 component (dihydrolipoamide acetyltransferase)